MSKFNVGDKVRIKGDLSECEFGYSRYMEEFVGKEATVVKVCIGGLIELDIDEQVWNWSENVLELIEENDNMNTKIEEGNKVNESDLKDSETSKEVEEKKEVENDNVKMKRIDYILNAKDNMQAILDETELDCDICPVAGEVCNGNCKFHYRKYLNEEIEVDKSKLKDSDVESITIGQALQSIYDIPPQIKINSDKIKEVNVDNENDNMNIKVEERNRINESDLKDSEISKEVEDKKNCKDCDYFVKSSLGNYCDFYGILLNIMHGCNEFQLKKHKEGIKDIKTENIENDPINPFMEEYKKIVTETMELCIKKNKDYGNATDESFKQFGDVSYQVRCFDKWSRINTLLKNGKAEVSESLEDSLLDLSNYLFLWVTSRRLKVEDKINK